MSRIIYASKNHPFYEKLSKLEGFTSVIPESSSDLLFDFSASNTIDKKKLFSIYKGGIISDLSLNNGAALLKDFPQLKAAFGAVYPSPKNTYEVFYKDQSVKNSLVDLFNEFDSNLLEVGTAGIGFIFPRTISQIINEAWFALEDELASEKAIDTAMLFGVNYPRGPLEWGDAAGLQNTVLLLEELYKDTKNKRYRVCQKLKEALE
jgi:3-hydroxybutyryl-CoA dehydrogenase